jgi:hypothetical protein
MRGKRPLSSSAISRTISQPWAWEEILGARRAQAEVLMRIAEQAVQQFLDIDAYNAVIKRNRRPSRRSKTSAKRWRLKLWPRTHRRR